MCCVCREPRGAGSRPVHRIHRTLCRAPARAPPRPAGPRAAPGGRGLPAGHALRALQPARLQALPAGQGGLRPEGRRARRAAAARPACHSCLPAAASRPRPHRQALSACPRRLPACTPCLLRARWTTCRDSPRTRACRRSRAPWTSPRSSAASWASCAACSCRSWAASRASAPTSTRSWRCVCARGRSASGGAGAGAGAACAGWARWSDGRGCWRGGRVLPQALLRPLPHPGALSTLLLQGSVPGGTSGRTQAGRYLQAHDAGRRLRESEPPLCALAATGAAAVCRAAPAAAAVELPPCRLPSCVCWPPRPAAYRPPDPIHPCPPPAPCRPDRRPARGAHPGPGLCVHHLQARADRAAGGRAAVGPPDLGGGWAPRWRAPPAAGAAGLGRAPASPPPCTPAPPANPTPSPARRPPSS